MSHLLSSSNSSLPTLNARLHAPLLNPPRRKGHGFNNSSGPGYVSQRQLRPRLEPRNQPRTSSNLTRGPQVRAIVR
jgi:hypothetical protein